MKIGAQHNALNRAKHTNIYKCFIIHIVLTFRFNSRHLQTCSKIQKIAVPLLSALSAVGDRYIRAGRFGGGGLRTGGSDTYGGGATYGGGGGARGATFGG